MYIRFPVPYIAISRLCYGMFPLLGTVQLWQIEFLSPLTSQHLFCQLHFSRLQAKRKKVCNLQPLNLVQPYAYGIYVQLFCAMYVSLTTVQLGQHISSTCALIIIRWCPYDRLRANILPSLVKASARTEVCTTLAQNTAH